MVQYAQASLAGSGVRAFGYSIDPEEGGAFQLATRYLQESKTTSAWKSKIQAHTNLPVWPRHSFLSLSLQAAISPAPVDEIPSSTVEMGGTSPSNLNLRLRGYPYGAYFGKAGAVASSEFTLPIWQFFKGFGAFPYFLKNLGAFGFYEAGAIRLLENRHRGLLTSAGGGLILNSIFFYRAPLQLRLQYSQGFAHDFGQPTFEFLAGVVRF